MSDPQSTRDRPQTAFDAIEDAWWSDDESAECELCESESATVVKYGLAVCRECDRTFLP